MAGAVTRELGGVGSHLGRHVDKGAAKDKGKEPKDHREVQRRDEGQDLYVGLGFLSPVLGAEALCLLESISPFCSSKLKLFSRLHPYKGKLCNQPNNAGEEYLLTGKMYTRILLSADSVFLPSLQQLFIGHFLHVRCYIYTGE